MTKTLGSLMSSSNSLKGKSSPSGATIPGVPIYTLGGNKLRIRDNDYELIPEFSKALSYTGYTGKSTKNQNDILMLNNIINELGHTGIGDRPSNRQIFITKTPPKLVEEIQNRTFDELDLEGQGFQKNIIPSKIFDNYTKLEVLLGLKLNGHSETLSEASNLID